MIRILLSLLVSLPALGVVDFNREVRPILSDNCFSCHGPDEKGRMAGLRLDQKEGVFREGHGGRIVTPGEAAASLLYQRISAEKKAQKMPPSATGRALTSAQIETIKRWIDEGAKWETHWAYTAPKRPDPPPVGNPKWVRNEIDRFILARLEKEGLKPSPEADKLTLLRRATFDLTGLPPTPKEADAFLADRAPGAYERAVDRLLASPHYGERMAMVWLDLARYADTHGYHIDSHRDMWHWRDWVIDAFNRNMPYDQFTVEQLAGDLLPSPTVSQKLATGFNRNHMINYEGGAIPEEYQNEYVIDRLEATSNTWLGTTMGCARCHDHKYDPISQRDFYRFYAFFNTIPEKGLDGRKGNAEPLLKMPSAAQESRLAELTGKIRDGEAAMKALPVAGMQTEWEKTALDTLPAPSKTGLLAHYEFDGNLNDSTGGYQHGRVLAGDPGFVNGMVGRAAEFNGETHAMFDLPPLGRTFALALWMRPGSKNQSVLLRKGPLEIGFDEPIPIPGLKRGAFLSVRLNGLEIRTKNRVIFEEWQHLALNYDGSGKASGLHLLLNGTPAATEICGDRFEGDAAVTGMLAIGDPANGPYRGLLDDLRIYSRPLSGEENRQLAVDEPARATVTLIPARRGKEQKDRLAEYFLTYAASEEPRRLHADLKQWKAEKEAIEGEIPTSMVMEEMEKPRESAVLGRGDYRNRGEIVKPEVPSTLPPLPKDAPRNRLTLARWLVDPQNPLPARVAVNRFWQMYFGLGIVKTAEDFGSQGESPVHPELLDWLATEFVRTNWDVKAMQRLIVTSATYRQASRTTPELQERDPENRLLARGPRFRLPAESVRDNALTAAGLLNDSIGGASVFPYQPKGIWEEIAYGDVYSAQRYVPSTGKDLYRRSMYSFWKRTSPPPALITFDASDREKCTARRSVTNTPLQALVLLNDPTYVEASRVLAQRMLTEAGADEQKRLRYGFRLATSRFPDNKELQILREMAHVQVEHFRSRPDEAKKLLAVGDSKAANLDAAELAGWTMVASTLLNLDETITKE